MPAAASRCSGVRHESTASRWLGQSAAMPRLTAVATWLGQSAARPGGAGAERSDAPAGGHAWLGQSVAMPGACRAGASLRSAPATYREFLKCAVICDQYGSAQGGRSCYRLPWRLLAAGRSRLRSCRPRRRCRRSHTRTTTWSRQVSTNALRPAPKLRHRQVLLSLAQSQPLP